MRSTIGFIFLALQLVGAASSTRRLGGKDSRRSQRYYDGKIYHENTGDDTYMGNGTAGDQVLWTNSSWVDEDGVTEGYSHGHCILLATEPAYWFYCHYTVEFAYGRLTFEGLAPDFGMPEGEFAITGGTGVFTGASGSVGCLAPANSTIVPQLFRHTLHLE